MVIPRMNERICTGHLNNSGEEMQPSNFDDIQISNVYAENGCDKVDMYDSTHANQCNHAVSG